MLRPRLFLIDSFGFIFRAYHARARSGAPPMRTSTGHLHRGGLHLPQHGAEADKRIQAGVHRRRLRERGPDLPRRSSSPSTRPTAPKCRQDLREQIPCVRRMLEAMRIPDPRIPGLRGRRRDRHHRAAGRRAGRHWTSSSSRATRTCCNWSTTGSTMFNPMKDDIWYDAAKAEEFMGVPPSAGGRPAGAEGRRHRQHPRRAGHRRQGREGPDPALRLGGEGARARRRSGAQDVSREPAEQSRPDPAEQEAGDHRHRGAGRVEPGGARRRRSRTSRRCAQIYKELEFFSLLREMAPVEVTRRQGLRRHSAPKPTRWTRGSPQIPAGALLARRRWSPGVGIAAHAGAGAGWCRSELSGACSSRCSKIRGRREGRARREGGDAGAGEAGIEARGMTDDVMLYAFLLSADPSGCSCEVLAEKLPRPEARRRPPMQQADCALELAREAARRRSTRAGSAKLYDDDRPAADRRAGAHGADRHPRSTRRSSACCPGAWTRRCSGSPARFTRSRQAIQHQLAATTGQGAV